MPLQGFHLGIELRDMLGPVIVSEQFYPQTLQHGGTFLRSSFGRIERDDAPGHQIGSVKEAIG